MQPPPWGQCYVLPSRLASRPDRFSWRKRTGRERQGCQEGLPSSRHFLLAVDIAPREKEDQDRAGRTPTPDPPMAQRSASSLALPKERLQEKAPALSHLKQRRDLVKITPKYEEPVFTLFTKQRTKKQGRKQRRKVSFTSVFFT